ncbi:TPA: diguanylate cyclase [Vibrio vulnificus]|nr:DEAD/DEAH box helicase family protein [Vibrio vulnificus]EGQ8027516.1 DEAD/DEAH box helicase family protein [Vibrio vulnificus]EJE8733696.1 DEAD/DEAH box helicase family protein [Vibrio vulnificus]EJO3992641.1 DEAD/DEAH box helicase family protein [Vibrio vulnificus]EKA7349207.1 DEAD/DEAH box helicase family protein [Vibrio vulnificus]ELP5900301.1 DEAD/DEAH box helicase family protein [Vibrio vulnificus]
MLRRWQSECINLALETYLGGKQHFLTQATPGAGKTFMAASLSKEMFDSKLIDFVVCFSPSKSVADSIQRSFSRVLSCTFDGKIGTVGCSITYQSLRHLSPKFWVTLSRYRVLCIFDEIHHCSGDSETNANAWGNSILTDVQSAARYTLALTGTPWRSNLTPVTLASYTNPEGQIVCDYQYSLAQAIKDRVCRRPKIVLVDCHHSVVSSPETKDSYRSMSELIEKGKVSYSMIIQNDDALAHILSEAVSRLQKIRSANKKAGGLIVASSVEHARYIDSILREDFNQSTSIVTYREQNAQDLINQFRISSTEWIVSVGMVSEGTDIPRLQVCCHLSNVKTELYFRQILGRILRTTTCTNQEAWFYTFAEPSLNRFAEEIENDIPETCRYIKINQEHTDEIDVLSSEVNPSLSIQDTPTMSTQKLLWTSNQSEVAAINSNTHNKTDITLNHFKQRVIEAFRYA